jgi:hypothetical protein
VLPFFSVFYLLVCKWPLYLFKYLQQLVCGSTWKNGLSSWDMKPRGLGFPLANKILRLLEFLSKCQFLVLWVKGVEVELMDRKWDWKVFVTNLEKCHCSMMEGFTVYFVGVCLILWKICSRICFPLSQGSSRHSIKKKKIKAASLKPLASQKIKRMVYLYVAATDYWSLQTRKCTHPMNLEEPDISCSVQGLNLLLGEITVLMKVDKQHLCQRIFSRVF